MMIDPYQWHIAAITALEHESSAAVSVRLDLASYQYRPGQHAIVRIKAPDGTRHVRQYSFASAPDQSLWLTIVRTPGGAVSTWFNDYAKAGDVIEISQPFTGPLAINPTDYRHCLMIAGGSGIVPLMSHLRALRNQTSDLPVTLLYSTRPDSQCYQSELVPNHSETIVIRQTDKESRFSSNDISPHLYDGTLVMICGSRSFVVTMRSIAAAQAPAENIMAEAFSL